jgi:hypothetical protein
MADPEEVWRSVEEREALRAVAEAFGGLRPEDRDVIAAAANETERGDTKRERDRFGLRLHRARSRLSRRLRDWLVAVPFRWRLDDLLPGAHQLASLATAAGVLGASAALGLVGDGRPAAATAEPRPVPLSPPGLTAASFASPGSPPSYTAQRPPAPRDRAGDQAPSPPPVARPPAPPPVVAFQRAEVTGPSGPLMEAATHEAPPRASLLCLRNVPVVGTECVAHPLRP